MCLLFKAFEICQSISAHDNILWFVTLILNFELKVKLMILCKTDIQHFYHIGLMEVDFISMFCIITSALLLGMELLVQCNHVDTGVDVSAIWICYRFFDTRCSHALRVLTAYVIPTIRYFRQNIEPFMFQRILIYNRTLLTLCP